MVSEICRHNKVSLHKLFFIELCFAIAANFALAQEWRPLSPLPDKEGFAAPFAGVSHGSLVVAGGANFPGRNHGKVAPRSGTDRSMRWTRWMGIGGTLANYLGLSPTAFLRLTGMP